VQSSDSACTFARLPSASDEEAYEPTRQAWRRDASCNVRQIANAGELARLASSACATLPDPWSALGSTRSANTLAATITIVCRGGWGGLRVILHSARLWIARVRGAWVLIVWPRAHCSKRRLVPLEHQRSSIRPILRHSSLLGAPARVRACLPSLRVPVCPGMLACVLCVRALADCAAVVRRGRDVQDVPRDAPQLHQGIARAFSRIHSMPGFLAHSLYAWTPKSVNKSPWYPCVNKSPVVSLRSSAHSPFGAWRCTYMLSRDADMLLMHVHVDARATSGKDSG
jgi:hypothetical protein